MLSPVKHQLSYQFYDMGPCGVRSSTCSTKRRKLRKSTRRGAPAHNSLRSNRPQTIEAPPAMLEPARIRIKSALRNQDVGYSPNLRISNVVTSRRGAYEYERALSRTLWRGFKDA